MTKEKLEQELELAEELAYQTGEENDWLAVEALREKVIGGQ